MPKPVHGLNAVKRRRSDGTVDFDFYYRATGLLIGRTRDGWTREAAEEKALALDGDTGKSGPSTGTFGELCALFLGSQAFKKKAAKTQREYRAHIELMRGMWENVPVFGITRKIVRAFLDTYEDRPWQGNAIGRTLRRLMNYGMKDLEMAGLVKNPAAGQQIFSTPPREQIWDQRRIDAFLHAAADQPRLRLALALMLYTVQRPADVLAMGRPALTVRDGRTWIRLKQAKTKALVDVPCHSQLEGEMTQASAEIARQEGARTAPRRKQRSDTTARSGRGLLVSSPQGLAWSYGNFGRAWDLVRRRANIRLAREAIQVLGGLPPRNRRVDRAEAKATIRQELLVDLQRRDLRRTGVVQLALAGATTPEIAALSGHKIDHVQKIIDTYLPRTGQVALGGVLKWEGSAGRVVTLAVKR